MSGDVEILLIRASTVDFLVCTLDLGFRHFGSDSQRVDSTREKAESRGMRIETDALFDRKYDIIWTSEKGREECIWNQAQWRSNMSGC
ncbi:hypothetical protein BHYA_0132g00200 [Botrytis hyacinthi]|uniref:Uncharacterized protein n=1 Tax=Botrytis hyacinthi TaxID=278943 RepID=A0A4Z1GNT7_9HELO|nr:hypothetical protein BHYA_0132g00200 [Botrytis hyacinthi]